MEKYISKNMSSHKNVMNNNVQIIFDKEDGKCGMKVSLEEIVDVWLETLEPELQQTLELEEKTRSEIEELETLQQEKKTREEDEKNQQVWNMLKLFLREQIVKVLNEKGLKINKSNIRSIIRECRIKIGYRTGFYCYSPMDILFTNKEWDEFGEECKKKRISLSLPIDIIYSGYRYENDIRGHYFDKDFSELRDSPISDWK